MHFHLPLSFLLLLQFSLSVWATASLIPPSTPPSASGTSSRSSSAIQTTNSATVTTSGSLSASSSASTTSSAQFPSLSGISSCVSNCLEEGVSRVNCSSVTDVNCYCSQPNFTAEVVDCILADCPDQVTTSESLAQQFCNIASTSVSLSFPFVPATSSSNSSTSSSTSSSSSSTSTAPPTSAVTSKSAAVWNVGNVPHGTFVALGMSMLGILLGAYIVQ